MIKIKNSEMEKKFKDAFKKAGIELPAKQENSVAKDSKNNHISAKPINAKQRKADQSVRNKKINKDVSKNNRGVKTNKHKKNQKRKTKAKVFNDGLPSLAAIRSAYGSSSKNNPNNNGKSKVPERTTLKAREFNFQVHHRLSC
ncbi:MAG: hypothetical protein KUG81_02050 [Gammaproteobacteria bacterium]|nr:hypothetical protein [Gammaproteobacteria bacterium]